MAKFGVFTVPDAKKVAEATRRTLGGPRTMLHVPYRPAIRHGGGGTSTDADDGFPTGTNGCDCSHCVEGVTMPASSTVCCESHLKLEFIDPVFGGLKEVLWTTGNVWLSDVFEGPSCEVEAADESECTGLGGTWVDPICTISNEYRWKLTVSATTGSTILELVIETDNGCDIVCAKYVSTEPWQCKCDNALKLKSWTVDDRSAIACEVCLKPPRNEPAADDAWIGACPLPEDARVPQDWLVRPTGFDGSASDTAQPFPLCGTGCGRYLRSTTGTVLCDINVQSVASFPGGSRTICGERMDCTWDSGVFSVGTTTACIGHAGQTFPVYSRTVVGLLNTGGVLYLYADVYCPAADTALGDCSEPPNPGVNECLGIVSVARYVSNAGFDTAGKTAAEIEEWIGEQEHLLVVCSKYECVGEAGCPDVCNETIPDVLTIIPGTLPGGAGGLLPPTSDGSCAGCTTDSPPADADPGACCIDSYCYEYMSEADCTTLTGTWHETLEDCESICEATGACCVCTPEGSVPEYGCHDGILQYLCEEWWSTWPHVWYGGLTCAELEGCQEGQPCGSVEDPLGSCCDEATGDCVDAVSDADCADTWTEGGSCEDCEAAPMGFCCTDGAGSCTNFGATTEAECDAESGVWFEGDPCECAGTFPGSCTCT